MPRRLLLILIAAAALALPAPAAAASPDLVVSEAYGGGGNSGAPLKSDFVEIFNRGTAAASLAGRSLQYASASGTGAFGASSTQLTELPAVTLPPGGSFVVREASGGAAVPEPRTDFADPSPINLSATAGKVALAEGTGSLGCNGGSAPCDAQATARIVDLVGYGSANFSEGAAPAPAPGNATSVQRAAAGCQDSDRNGSDFAVAAPDPRPSSEPARPCGAATADEAPRVESTEPADGAGEVPADATVTVTFSEDVAAAPEAFALACTRSGTKALEISGGPRTFSLTPSEPFAAGEQCTLTVAAEGVRDRDADDPPDAMAAEHRSSFSTQGLQLRVAEIQGAAHVSPFAGDRVSSVPGVITARRSNGFYLQDPEPDGDERTSEGIFVFTGGAPPSVAAPGAAVLVSGQVDEFRPGGASGANLSSTQITRPTVTGAGSGTVAAVVLGPEGRSIPTEVIDDDSTGDAERTLSFDPAEDGLDFYESLEGMLTEVPDPVAVGPTSDFGEIAVLASGGEGAGVRTARGGIVVRPGDFNPERLLLDDVLARTPAVNTGDGLTGPVRAVVDYSFGNFKLLPLASPERIDGGLERERTEAPRDDQLSVASVNVENLDPGDPPEKFARLAEVLVDNLRSPDLVAVEEIQDDDGARTRAPTGARATYAALTAAIRAAGGPDYEVRQIDPEPGADGGQPGGNIRVGFLFREDRGLSFVDRPGGDATTPTAEDASRPGAQLTLSPGRIEPSDPAFANSRKPLAGEFRYRGRTVIAVANHFASKGGDDPLFGRFQPPVRDSEVQRHRQAEIVGAFVDDLLAADKQANVVVLGDLNDFDFSETLGILEGERLVNLAESLPLEERYSYVFGGNSQVLDQILVSRSLTSPRAEYDSVHVNAEFADQVSDHDPQVARLRVTGKPAGGR